MENSRESQYIIISKNAVGNGPGPRNGIADLLIRAGYDAIADGFNRSDEIRQGDFTFRGVKGSDALSNQLELFQGKSIGVLMGSDVLADADVRAERLGVASRIEMLLSLGIGACKMRCLVPEESSVKQPQDISGRLIFSKYSALAERALAAMNIDASIRQTEGADTRVNDWRAKDSRIGAFEIVGSGDTARQNKLQIVERGPFVYPTGNDMLLPYLNLDAISTDLYVTNLRSISGRSRAAIRELGLALESARLKNTYVTFKFNVPRARVPAFARFGIKGPTETPIWTPPDEAPWSALEIAVLASEENRVRAELLELKATGLLTLKGLKAELNASESEVIRILPFTKEEREQPETNDDADARRKEVAMWLLSLRDTIAQRAASGDEKSSTVRALSQGIEFCANRCATEAQELSLAIRREPTQNAVDEAGQCFYWFLVSLKAKSLELAAVLQNLESSLNVSPEDSASDLDRLLNVLQAIAVDTKRIGSRGIEGEAVSFADEATRFSSAMRKKEDPTPEVASVLEKLLKLLKVSGIALEDVMEKERGKK